VGLVGESFGSVSPSLAEVERDSEGSGTGRDVDGRTTSKVESAKGGSPTVETPSPGGDGTVDDSQPDKDEDHDRSDTCSFSETTSSEYDGDELDVSMRLLGLQGITYSKHSLVGSVDDSGETSRSDGRLAINTHQTEVLQCSDEPAYQRVTSVCVMDLR
jgi:hypothetical protein